MHSLITVNEFKLLNPGSYTLLDARAGAGAMEQYKQGHLPGALFADLETKLSALEKNPAAGGRHPLPDPATFSKVLGEWGIGPKSHVIVYDDKNGANAAARCWWMLRAAGLRHAQVLDGGLQAAEKDGIALVSGMEVGIPTGPYPFNEWQLPYVDIQEVGKLSKDPDWLVIDVRDAYRYNGESEPIDIIAGHIPGATNIPFITNLDAGGTFLSPSELRKKYTDALAGRDTGHLIVHCGSGVTACHTLLAMDHAGLKGASLYVGSWSEWCNAGMPVAKGSEPG